MCLSNYNNHYLTKTLDSTKKTKLTNFAYSDNNVLPTSKTADHQLIEIEITLKTAECHVYVFKVFDLFLFFCYKLFS